MARWVLLSFLVALFLNHAGARPDRPDILVEDFEGKDYGKWKTTGTAFGPGPARGTLPNQMPVSGYLGEGLVNSFFGGDGATGTLTSPEIKIERKFVTFLIGGGHHPGKTCMNLLVDGKVVRTATGPNKQPGGTERLDPYAWDVAEFEGKNCVFEIVDKETGGWGHINIDHIVQTDKKPAGLLVEAKREIVAGKKYLTLPVQTGQPKRRVVLLVDGVPFREFEIELATTKTDLVAVVELASVQGKTITLRAERIPEDLRGWLDITTSDELPDAATAYKEKHRPDFHFTSRRGWLNDPNGLVFLDGEWHLYYQHNPYGWDWGNMHWGHAVSKDLLRWRELPIALYPMRFGDWAFSGSAVVDKANTAGWKRGDADTLVAAFTSTGRGECIVYSNDRGRTWNEYEGNPVVKHSGRDPRLLWHADSKQWVMAVYDEFDGKQWIAFHTSPDLKKWTFQSRIEGFYECPDLFDLSIEGTQERVWVLYAADGKYLLGDFDGKVFKPRDSKKIQLWHGNFYAAQTFSDVPSGRRIQIGWGQGIAFPGMPFNQQMTIPCDLVLRRTPDGLRLHAQPVRELANLHGAEQAWTGVTVEKRTPFKVDPNGDRFDVRFVLDSLKATQVTLTARGIPIVYDPKAKTITCRGKTLPVLGPVELRILIDRGSVEIFANEGRTALVAGGLLPEEMTWEVTTAGGNVVVTRLVVSPLKSARE
jgi:fructan beta-fructosidase